MKPERLQQIEAIVHGARQLAPGDRAAFLAEVCVGDEDLCREVEALLAYDKRAKDIIERPAMDLAARQIRDESLAEASTAVIAAAPNLSRIGPYELQSLLGKGGMGEVHLAFDHRLQRQIAIKLLPPQFTTDAQRVRRFTQEARAASALNHPNILTVHEIGESEGTHYIVTEYIEGETLRQHISRAPHQQMGLSETMVVVTQMAEALATAHAAGIIHRDLKPENLMLRKDGYVKILDFGLAKLVEPNAPGADAQRLPPSLTESGVVMGTPRYMSPEQARGEKVDARTDIFSLGVILYEMIAGHAPFVGATASETIAAILRDEPQPLTASAPEVSAQLERIIKQALRKDRAERQPSVQALLTDLQQVKKRLESDAETTRELMPAPSDELLPVHPEAETKGLKPAPRLSMAVVGLMVLLLVATGLGAYFLWTGNPLLVTGNKKSLAVLPFINASQDANAEYLSDGITESVINNLSQLAGLKVMSRNSAFRFKSNQRDTHNIAAQLGVEALVTGDIKQLGDKLIINVRLIDASDDSQIWGNQYVKTSADILVTQNEIAQAVAQNLRLKLTNSEQQQLDKRYTQNVQAYEFYLRGRYHYFKITEPEIRQGIKFYQQAIDADPSYALAYAGMADAYRTLPIAGSTVSSKEAFPQAKAAAKKALELDGQLAEAHIVLGWAGFLFDWDWRAAEKEFKRALELSPNNSDAHRGYAHFLSNSGRHDEAITEGRRARELSN
ncbi:MAG: protein kinase [Blastocatellia bacterium]|nr:protein kinase [Blastocatellia bacterium]